jgi:hypothetical protein
VIKQALIATALVASLVAPALADNRDHQGHDRNTGNQTRQSQPNNRQGQTRPQYVAPQRAYQPQRNYTPPQRNYTPQRNYGGGNYGGGNNGQYAYHPNYAPPQARYEQRGAYRPGYAWQPGYYQYNDQQQYYWTPGQYIQQPYAGANYDPGQWQLLNGLWTWLSGQWH